MAVPFTLVISSDQLPSIAITLLRAIVLMALLFDDYPVPEFSIDSLSIPSNNIALTGRYDAPTIAILVPTLVSPTIRRYISLDANGGNWNVALGLDTAT